MREKAKKWFPQSLENYLQRINNELDTLLVENPDKKEIISQRRKEFKAIQYNDAITPEDIWERIILDEKNTSVPQVLNNMTWQFLVFDKWPIFLTSDNPVFFFEWLGIGKEHSEVSFPITDNIVLWATGRTDLKEEYVQTTESIAKEINRRTISFAQNYIYFSSCEKWITKLVNKNSINLNRITQPSKRSRKRLQRAIE